MLTLWDLIDPLLSRLVEKKPGGAKAGEGARPAAEAGPATGAQANVTPRTRGGAEPIARVRAGGAERKAEKRRAEAASMQAKYDAVVEHMLAKHQVRVRKWRTSMSGVAWYVTYRDGRRVNLIESPRPKGPMSAAVFLHEIGHHAIGFDVYKPRCLEEYHAWKFSLEAMEAHGLNITDAVRVRMHRSLHYAVAKAKRRGIKKIPVELEPFEAKPPRARRGRAGSDTLGPP
jgi:uncharacterized NAD(P)/FAD-binding protein YdhS